MGHLVGGYEARLSRQITRKEEQLKSDSELTARKLSGKKDVEPSPDLIS